MKWDPQEQAELDRRALRQRRYAGDGTLTGGRRRRGSDPSAMLGFVLVLVTMSAFWFALGVVVGVAL